VAPPSHGTPGRVSHFAAAWAGTGSGMLDPPAPGAHRKIAGRASSVSRIASDSNRILAREGNAHWGGGGGQKGKKKKKKKKKRVAITRKQKKEAKKKNIFFF
jgi:hypothetical protein